MTSLNLKIVNLILSIAGLLFSGRVKTLAISINNMSENIEKKMQKTKELFHHLRQKLIVRVWSLAKRLDPKQMKGEGKKKKGQFSRLGNKGNK